MGWLQFSRSASAVRADRCRPRLSVEALEDRCVPAEIAWDGGAFGSGTGWCDQANWVGDRLPGSTDDAVIGTAYSARTLTVSCAVSVRSVNTSAQIQVQRDTFSLGGSSARSLFNSPFHVQPGAALVLTDSRISRAIGNTTGRLINAGTVELRLQGFGNVVQLDVPVVNQNAFRIYGYHLFTGELHTAERGFTNEATGTLVLEVGGAGLDFTSLDNAGRILLNQGAYLGRGYGLGGTLLNREGTAEINVLGNTRFQFQALDNRGLLRVQGGILTFFPAGAFDIGVTNAATGRMHAAGGNIFFFQNGFTGQAIPFTNNGSLRTDAGREIQYEGNRFANYSGTTLTGGTLDNAGKFFFSNANIATNNATVLLHGPNAGIFDLSSPQPQNGLRNFTTNVANGNFTIRGGANFSSASFSNHGTVNIDGDTLFFVGGTYTQTAGVTQLFGGRLSATTILIGENSTLAGSGVLSGTVENRGDVRVGGTGTAGILGILGNYTQVATGTLWIEIGGLAPAVESDLLFVTGEAALGGTLRIDRLNNYLPNPDDLLLLLWAEQGIRGDFSNFLGLELTASQALYPFVYESGYFLWTYSF